MSEYLVNDSDLTAVASAIRTKGGTGASLTFPSGFVSAIDAIPTGGGSVIEEKDVNFYDYDGTLLYSYSAVEAAALTEMPSNPSHEGFTAQGWNYTLQDMKSQVAACGACDIGAHYITSDEKTYIDVELIEGRLQPYISMGVNGTVNINWGDGQPDSVVSGTNLNITLPTRHIYPSAGKYTIILTVASGEFKFNEISNDRCFFNGNSSVSEFNTDYGSMVKAIRIGKSCILGAAFKYCLYLKTINIPSNMSITNNPFEYCRSLVYVTIPRGTTTLYTNFTANAQSLKTVSIPNTVTTFGNNVFFNCHSLHRIVIPNSVTTIGKEIFQGCYVLSYLNIPNSITTIGTSTFYSCYLLEEVNIPNTLANIPNSFMNGCRNILNINLPNNITSIGDNAFQYCARIFTITIPEQVGTIGNYALSGCRLLTEIHFRPTTPPTLGTSVFGSLSTTCKIYVPTGTLEAYTSNSKYPTATKYTYIEE